MKKTLLFLLLFSIFSPLFSSCTGRTKEKNTFFQYNIWAAFVNKVFEGQMTVQELKEKGDTGLGSFDVLDGELVMVKGEVYRIRENGEISIAANTDKIVYADAAFLGDTPSKTIELNTDFNGLIEYLNSALESRNRFYVLEIKGRLKTIKTGGLHKQKAPFKTGLDVLIPARPTFFGENIEGTLVGFFCPEFIGDINTKGYHFHFISEDKKLGGHLMEANLKGEYSLRLKRLDNYTFRMPESSTLDTVSFQKSFQYDKK